MNVQRSPRVVALHGSGASGRMWTPLAERVADVPFAAPDLFGHGEAPDWPGPPESIVAADAERVARLTGASDRVHLVGHSYGGAVAIAFALAHPLRVRSLTLFEPVLFGALFDAAPAESAEIRAVAAGIVEALRNAEPERAAEGFVDFWSGRGHWATMPAARRESVARRMPTISAHFASLAASPLRLSRLRAIAAPVLHLAGVESPKSMRRLDALLRQAMPDASFVAMTAMGHMGPVSHPHTVAQRVERHVRARIAEDAVRAAAQAA